MLLVSNVMWGDGTLWEMIRYDNRNLCSFISIMRFDMKVIFTTFAVTLFYVFHLIKLQTSFHQT